MKKHNYALGACLLAGGILVSGFGLALEAGMPGEYEFLYEDQSPVALPFMMMADGNLDDVLETWFAEEEPAPVTEPTATEAPSMPQETTVPTEESTAPEVTAEVTEPPSTELVQETEPAVETTSAPELLYPVIPEPAVPGEYFDDTLFIGDSRVCGLRDFARLGRADYFCDVGMTTFNIWERKTSDWYFSEMGLEKLLRYYRYGKIYISLGINACGYPVKNFQDQYTILVNTIRQFQPDAIIVLHGIIAVSEEYANGRSYYQPDQIAERNEFISTLADGKEIFYIDANPVFTDSDGYLMKSVSNDGCHFTAKEYALWSQWIQSCPPIK